MIGRKTDPATGRMIATSKPEPITVRGKCIDCAENDQERKAIGRDGLPRYGPRCGRCGTRNYRARLVARGGRRIRDESERSYTKHRKDSCEGCGFVPNTPNQLEVDHINGNHKDNSPENLWTLCSNCHKEKTWLFDQNGAI